jgi:hypothetical protein
VTDDTETIELRQGDLVVWDPITLIYVVWLVDVGDAVKTAFISESGRRFRCETYEIFYNVERGHAVIIRDGERIT